MINLIDSKWPKTMESRQIAEEFNNSTATMTADQLYGVQMYGSQELTKGYHMGFVVGVCGAVICTVGWTIVIEAIKEEKKKKSKKN